ncbi:hypothetical protein B0H15DRAFT_949767 [Mycena belliarum]|uniref:Uncharacterized protein n=1 Tax=Mycena belliarum TaxID=1033014 RepID=A0AAD6U2E7_9AGAR|nr:hypothetical protein B0H15DRAFT_949767 [Mycena belliae]
MSDPRFIVSATLKKNLVAEINKVLRKVQSADVDAAIRAGAITELNELLEDLHAEEDVIKSAAKRIMEVATQKSSPAKRALERIWRNYVINSEAAKKVADEARAIKAAATLSGPRNTPSSVRSQRFRDDFYHGKPPSHPGMNTNTSVGHLQPGSYGGMQQGQYAAASTPELGQWQMQQQYSQPNLSQQFIQPNYQQPAAYQQMQQGAQWNPAAHQGQYDIGTRPISGKAIIARNLEAAALRSMKTLSSKALSGDIAGTSA